MSKNWQEMEVSKQGEFVKGVMERVVVGHSGVRIEVNRMKLAESLLGQKSEYEVDGAPESKVIQLTADFKPFRRGSELRFVQPKGSHNEGKPIPSLVKALARGRNWYERVVAGEVGSVGELAKETGLHSTYIKRIFGCAMLSPEITEIVLSGKHRPDLKLQDVLQCATTDWREQTDAIALEWKSSTASP